MDGNTNQANRRTTSGGGSSSFSSLFGLYVDQLVETKEHVWFSSREAALVSINVNSLLIVEGDHFHGAINGSNSVGGLGNVYHGMCHLCYYTMSELELQAEAMYSTDPSMDVMLVVEETATLVRSCSIQTYSLH